MASLHPFHSSLPKNHHEILLLRLPSRRLPQPMPRARRPFPFPSRRLSCRSSSSPSVERLEEKKRKASGKRRRVRIWVRLDHQVAFGEHVAVLGSAKELGLWKKHVPMDWTPEGWVCELELCGGEVVEYKFVILMRGRKGMIWEDGDNRVLKLPAEGKFDMVCRWNKTGEAVDLLGAAIDEEVEELESEDGGDATASEDGGLVSELVPSPFVEQWQGRAASFMRSNEHKSLGTERKWDTDGLNGVVLKVVEGDQVARNWWRKVLSGLLALNDLTFSSEDQMEAMKRQVAELTNRDSSAQARIKELENELAEKDARLKDAETISAKQQKEISELHSTVETANNETTATIEAFKRELKDASKKAIEEYKTSTQYNDDLSEECYAVYLDGFKECKEIIQERFHSSLVSMMDKIARKASSPAAVTDAPTPTADEPQDVVVAQPEANEPQV